ncbi:hypothetical protein HYN59_06135 [Flavobacterium album]|uniref:Leucine-rich repeat domain-containing protein n=1 Tax=Flavobacterium album TaxID=2175091 RepID=A0A2S1QWF6_9FLAO|nr:hypothetical protein [Flavobacterium album]AWH84725.1 hypothetical protein HYN59_06135 [Flavobacterium album]
MNYKEIFSHIRGFGARKIYDFLAANPEQKPEGVDEMLLAVITTLYDKDLKKNFKTMLGKIGGEPVKQALKVVSKRDYSNYSAMKNLAIDVPELEKIEGFNTLQFLKYLSIVSHTVRDMREHFLEKASDEEIKYYLLNELYDNNDPNIVRLYIGDELSERVAQLVWDVVPQLAPSLASLTCRTEGKVHFDFDTIDMPNIYEIKIGGDFDKFPSFVFDQPSLQKLNIRTNLDVFPEGAGKLLNLKELVIKMPVTTLPDDIFSLTEITWFTLYNTRLTAVPEAIGNFVKLKNIGLSKEDNPEIKTIPESIFALPNLPQIYKDDIKAEFMPDNEYEVLYNAISYFIKEFENIPLVKELISKYKANEAPNYFPELAIAVTKCYYEDEHGRSLGTYYNYIDDNAPEKLKQVNKALKSFKYIDETTTPEDYDKMRKKLEPFDWFDTEKFISLCEVMVVDIYEKYPFEKW